MQNDKMYFIYDNTLNPLLYTRVCLVNSKLACNELIEDMCKKTSIENWILYHISV